MIILDINFQATKTDTIKTEIEITYVYSFAHAWSWVLPLSENNITNFKLSRTFNCLVISSFDNLDMI